MSSSEKTKNEEKSSKIEPKSIFREYFESLVTTLVMALFGMTFIIQAVTVPTGSMQNTIMINDYFLVNKFIFAPKSDYLPFLPQRDIVRGDIVVFKYPGYRDGLKHDDPPAYQTNYIKRVIGLPGETVEFKDNQVYINGVLLPEHRLVTPDPHSQTKSNKNVTDVEPQKPEDKWSVTYWERSMAMVKEGNSVVDKDMKYGVANGKMQVPENQYFVMGDNRNNSQDSRYWGFVPRELIIGQALFVYFSCEGGTSFGSCITNPRFSRLGHVIQ
jgi:signal peptidase I